MVMSGAGLSVYGRQWCGWGGVGGVGGVGGARLHGQVKCLSLGMVYRVDLM